jgi:catechol 2,3-dioxygenase-like lactoylglutathione lyase family enzyme
MLFRILAAFLAVLSSGAALAQSTTARPPITGISHIAIYTSDPVGADHYYRDIVGAARLPDPERMKGVDYCLSPTQFIEVLRLPPGMGINRLDHIAFNTADANGMRTYLATSGWKTPQSVIREFDGTIWFEVLDPEGNTVEFVQPGGSLKRSVNAPNAIGRHIVQLGILVHSREAEDKFYKDLLGFKPHLFGGMKEGRLEWVSQQVPDGYDRLEYMLSAGTGTGIPADMTQSQLGVLDHFSIGEASVLDAYKVLNAGNRLTGRHDPAPKIGRDGKYQFNMYDPDGVRLELMDFDATNNPCCSTVTAEDSPE